MPFLTIGARRHRLEPGETTLGGADGALELPGVVAGPAVAVVLLAPDDRVSLRRLRPDVPIAVDGAPLGDAERVLAHGAKIEVAGRTLFFGDARRSGGTEPVAGLSDERLAALDAALPPAVAADSGGRLVSVSDGREWPVPDGGLEIGRDPGCDVVLGSPDASRWHAVIERTLLGYVVRDTSSNGVRVNGARVQEVRPLSRGDVLRIGDEEFRFDADETSPEPGPPAGEAAEALPRAPLTPSRRVERAPLLATLEIANVGPRRGERVRIEHEPVRVGRSSRAEVRFDDESVSSTHATLERRDGAWTVVDHDSTNGTYVDGERIYGARRLTGAVELRFGNVKTVFRPIAAASVPSPERAPTSAEPAGDTASTRGIVGLTEEQLRRAKRRS
jgi:pSer/pThr/pTyr-binding forkhead associated (FHA) protein